MRKDGEKKLDKSSAEVRERVSRLLEKQKLDLHLQKIEKSFPVEVVDEQFK